MALKLADGTVVHLAVPTVPVSELEKAVRTAFVRVVQKVVLSGNVKVVLMAASTVGVLEYQTDRTLGIQSVAP